MKYFILIISCLIISFTSFSQDQFIKDSLLTAYKNADKAEQQVEILVNLSKLHFNVNLLHSLEYIDEALTIAQKENLKKESVSLFRARGGILTYIGKYNNATEDFLAALKIAEEINDNAEIFVLYNNLGAVHDNLNNPEKAIEVFFKGLEVYNKLPEELKQQRLNKLGALYNNIGINYWQKNDYKSAEVYYYKSLEVALKISDKRLEVTNYHNLAALYGTQNKYKETYKYIRKAIDLSNSINDIRSLAKSYNAMSAYYLGNRAYEKALMAADSSYTLSEQVGAIETKQEAVEKRYKTYKLTGDFDRALEAHEEYKALSDSLINEKIISQVTQANMMYEFEKKEQIRLAQMQRTRYITIIIISSLILGLIIIVLLLLLSKIRNKTIKLQKEQLEKDIEQKNKELTTNVLYMVKKNEVIISIVKKLLKIKNNLKEENKEPIQKIIYELQSGSEDEVWSEFEYRFKHVHSEFYKNLQKKFPDLTPSEVKLAALLKLNMASKEIATLTGQSVQSVHMARYRLRKKLDIANSEVNLVSFLNRI